MNYLAAENQHVPRLGEDLKESREHWKEIKNWMVWLSIPFLCLAIVFRGCNLFLEFFGFGLLGASNVTGKIAASLDSVETNYYYVNTGQYSHTERECGFCACICYLITLAACLAGIGCVIASVICWIFAYLFTLASCVYCFRTDEQFELSCAEKILKYETQIQSIEQETPQNNDPAYVAAFEATKQQKIERVRVKLQNALIARQKEQQKRGLPVSSHGFDIEEGIEDNDGISFSEEKAEAQFAIPMAEVVVETKDAEHTQEVQQRDNTSNKATEKTGNSNNKNNQHEADKSDNDSSNDLKKSHEVMEIEERI